MNNKEINKELKLVKLFVTEVNPDFEYNGKIFSWKLNAKLPREGVTIEICERNKTFEIEHLSGNIVHACLYVSKAKFTDEVGSGIKGKYIGKNSPTVFFSELLEIERIIEMDNEELEVSTDLLEETAAAIFNRDWNSAFGIGLYSEVHMFEALDGVFILTDNLFSDTNLEVGTSCYMNLEEVFINSYNMVK